MYGKTKNFLDTLDSHVPFPAAQTAPHKCPAAQTGRPLTAALLPGRLPEHVNNKDADLCTF